MPSAQKSSCIRSTGLARRVANNGSELHADCFQEVDKGNLKGRAKRLGDDGLRETRNLLFRNQFLNQ
ncbi:hypothetical protein VD0002_g3606 [Verticillium dahliae]|uniref:Uncharacterized protein n=1 Tax=Verticillium dahliae TaxID=27337 RepID=A0A2J8FK18_VERDA|nr:hypothetical protein BJF96_g4658 [Verticillium dahliae]PNH44100.1 hypothetical protein VD0004_g3480 [Verticillium dahliae]PNH52163.1 hypothetical protein VD0003_g5147 [Verticillium dahliae]PNH65372.1 hypothetical protein VD0002_g3606 [Verticillium dahliae]PNH74097.1 hypothetical protein VD0001_g3441 [Verticillium dahliae]